MSSPSRSAVGWSWWPRRLLLLLALLLLLDEQCWCCVSVCPYVRTYRDAKRPRPEEEGTVQVRGAQGPQVVVVLSLMPASSPPSSSKHVQACPSKKPPSKNRRMVSHAPSQTRHIYRHSPQPNTRPRDPRHNDHETPNTVPNTRPRDPRHEAPSSLHHNSPHQHKITRPDARHKTSTRPP